VAALAVLSVLLQPGCRLQPPALERAALLADHGKESEAIGVLEEHLATHADAIAERRQLIRLYGSVGRLDRAQAQTERLAEILPPNSPVPWVELGHAQELSHHYEEALAAYDHAARVAPSDSLGPKTGGLRAARWGELDLAEPRLAEAVRRDPSDAAAWHALGLVRLGLGQLEPARQAYGAGLHANPQSLENRLGLATVALRSNQPEQALREYEQLLVARPSFTGAMLGKSWSLILLGRFDAAEAVLHDAEALGADPESVARQRHDIRERKARTP
jgi:tetratricopeptide (TPR) repeat protein